MLFLDPIITAYILTLSFILGAVLASFIGCMASRRESGASVLRGRSKCDECGHTLSLFDLVPIAGYIARRGRCKYCGARIPRSCLIGELALACSFVLAALRFDVTPELALCLFFICVLFYVSLTDLSEHIIPDGALLVCAAVRLLWFFIFEPFSWRGLLLLAVDGLSFSLPVLLLTLLLEHILKREAMGGGDIKLLAVLGLYLGIGRGILMLLFACAAGIIFAAALQRRGGGRGIPFGPFLSLGAFVSLIFGDALISAYLSLFAL